VRTDAAKEEQQRIKWTVLLVILSVHPERTVGDAGPYSGCGKPFG